MELESIFVMALVVTGLFCLVKFIEMKYIEKEMKPLKYLVQDAAIVWGGSLIAGYVVDKNVADFLSFMTDSKVENPAAALIFTDEPGF